MLSNSSSQAVSCLAGSIRHSVASPRPVMHKRPSNSSEEVSWSRCNTAVSRRAHVLRLEVTAPFILCIPELCVCRNQAGTFAVRLVGLGWCSDRVLLDDLRSV